jgi:hypothetical protein
VARLYIGGSVFYSKSHSAVGYSIVSLASSASSRALPRQGIKRRARATRRIYTATNNRGFHVFIRCLPALQARVHFTGKLPCAQYLRLLAPRPTPQPLPRTKRPRTGDKATAACGPRAFLDWCH